MSLRHVTVNVTLLASMFLLVLTQLQAVGGDGTSNSPTTSDPVDNSSETFRNEAETPAARMKSLIEALRYEEGRYGDYSATWRNSRSAVEPDDNEPDVAKRRRMSVVITGQQRIRDKKFNFLSDTVTTSSTGQKLSHKHQTVFDGVKTLSIEDDNCVAEYLGASEPPQLLPPHCWGVFHLTISCPLSVYLSGTEAVNSHPKVAKHTGMAVGYEIENLEAEIVGDEPIDNVDCVIARVQRRHEASSSPEIQYFWLAKNRNLQVARSRTAYLSKGIEIPVKESRVTKWRKLTADVWYAKLIEVFDISPQAAAKKSSEVASPNATEVAIDQLIIESAVLKPEPTAAEFQLPVAPGTLPKFTVDDQSRLIGSPFHPKPVDRDVTMTVNEILDRLKLEEARYDPCEFTLTERDHYLFRRNVTLNLLSHPDRSGDSVYEYHSRYALQGVQRYRETERFRQRRNGSVEDYLSREIEVDDGTASQVTYVSHPGNVAEQTSNASIHFGPDRHQVSVKCAHSLLVDAAHVGTFGKWLESSQNNHQCKLELLGDEQIGELICHKLKGSFADNNPSNKPVYFYLWLAVDRNLLPIRYQYHNCRQHPTLPSVVAFANDLREVKPGIWSPTRISELEFLKAWDGLSVSRLRLERRSDCDIDEVSLEPIEEEKRFSQIDVPKGTQVNVIGENNRVLGQFLQPATGRLDFPHESLQKMIDAERKRQNEEQQSEAEESQTYLTSIDTSSGRFAESATGRLLNQLEQHHAHPDLFNQSWRGDIWRRTIRSIVELGPEAVPELITELEQTNNERMLQSLGFILRAINDPRAVPALIRAIQKTVPHRPGIILMNCKDPELMAFFKQHEFDGLSQKNAYHIIQGPMREICCALRRITGAPLREDNADRINRQGLPAEQRQLNVQHHELAKKWADWWNQHSKEFGVEEQYSLVDLLDPVFVKTPKMSSFFRATGEIKGLLLSSTADPRAKQVFYDLDTGRAAVLPDKFQTADQTELHDEEIFKWATEEGFDLMGTQCDSSDTGTKVFAIRGLGLRAWELNPDRWKKGTKKTKLDELIEDARPVSGLLVHHDSNSDRVDPKATAPFLVITAEGTVAMISIGIEVHDDSEKPGTFFSGESNLNPKANAKGRRFSVRYLEEIE